MSNAEKLRPKTVQETQELVRQGLMAHIIFGRESLAYIWTSSNDPSWGIDTYQKIQGRQKGALFDIENHRNVRKANETLRLAENAFAQLRVVIPDIDLRNAEYEKQLKKMRS